MATLTRHTLRAGSKAVTQALDKTLKPAVQRRKPPPGAGDWLPGVALGPTGMRRFQLYRPPGVKLGERLPLLVMLHGCGQDAKRFALSTRMNALAARERFLVLYPEQDRLANAQGCWNWFDTQNGRALAEAQLIMAAIDQVCLLYPADRQRVAMAGLSAGASMAALLAARHPERFKAVAMHSGVPPGTAHSGLSALGAMNGLRSPKPLAARRLPLMANAAASPVSLTDKARVNTWPYSSPHATQRSSPHIWPQASLHTSLKTASAKTGAAPIAAKTASRPAAAESSEANRWPPLLVIHGGADAVVSASNGMAAAQVWAAATEARPAKARTVQRGQRHAMTVTDFKHRGRTRVTLVEVGRLGHAWSGGAARQPFSDALGPDASRMVWAFAAKQFREPGWSG